MGSAKRQWKIELSFLRLGNNLLDHVAVYVGQAEITAVVAVGQFLMV